MTQLNDFTSVNTHVLNKHGEINSNIEPYRQKIEINERAFIQLQPLALSESEKSSSVFSSKLGGVPYIKNTHDYPLDKNGNMMKLVAQINFSELTQAGLIDETSIFPHQGLLQFFIPVEFPWGGTLEQDSAVIYHKDISANAMSNPEIDEISHSYDEFAMDEEHLLIDSQLALEYCGVSNREFDQIFNSYELSEEEFDSFAHFYNGGFKIGGYAEVVDRDDVRPENADILLLQIDSTVDGKICWSDAGVAQFFIPRDALIKKDFNQAFFTWNCS